MAELTSAIARAVEQYDEEWQKFVTAHHLGQMAVRPTAIGWKVADLPAFTQVLGELLEGDVEQSHIGDVNGRYIASIVFHEPVVWNIRIVKLMQRRTGSEDPLGFDHVDFLTEDFEDTKGKLDTANVAFEVESNDAHEWLSVRFSEGGRLEAKFVDHTVLDVCVAELQASARSL